MDSGREMKQKLKAFAGYIADWVRRNKKKSAVAFVLLLIYYFRCRANCSTSRIRP
jgi:hypothetical protein